MKALNIFIRELRTDRELKQSEVAKALGISQQYYSKYESGKYELPVRHLVNLSKLYNLNIEYILQLTDFKYSYEKLNEMYSDNITVGKLLTDSIALNPKNRKLLLEYLEFLKSKQS